ncbi:MAG: hypothetical protein KHY36_14150 [Subdoligranulum variabile]|jgi:type I restriction enzyme S subunit|uniref:Restriction endonuclease subunit S n=1 Tax=Subdoligranulum variabile TaxID=214851 RepID=A0A943HKS0_9FIRM|nr:hypothetical protein [Subdoligranulum variabile]
MPLTKVKIGNLIRLNNQTNADGRDLPFYGLNKDKEFMPTVASITKVDKCKYKVATKGRFVFSGMQTGRDVCIRLGLYDKDFDALVSPAYITFDIISDKILPEFLFMMFKSSEMDRYGAFLSDGTVRANLDWDVFCDIELTVPSIEIQRKYVLVYKTIRDNIKNYQEFIDNVNKNMCPILVRGALQEGE